MKLNIFNPWKPLGKVYGIDVELQTSRVPNSKVFVSYIRDTHNRTTIVASYGNDPDTSRDRAIKTIKSFSGDDIRRAVENKEILNPNQKQPEQKHIDWRDGIGHSYRAQKRIVGESKEERKQRIRNFVAKNANKFNKAGPMKDKKNTYTRKDKFQKQLGETE